MISACLVLLGYRNPFVYIGLQKPVCLHWATEIHGTQCDTWHTMRHLLASGAHTCLRTCRHTHLYACLHTRLHTYPHTLSGSAMLKVIGAAKTTFPFGKYATNNNLSVQITQMSRRAQTAIAPRTEMFLSHVRHQ